MRQLKSRPANHGSLFTTCPHLNPIYAPAPLPQSRPAQQDPREIKKLHQISQTHPLSLEDCPASLKLETLNSAAPKPNPRPYTLNPKHPSEVAGAKISSVTYPSRPGVRLCWQLASGSRIYGNRDNSSGTNLPSDKLGTITTKKEHCNIACAVLMMLLMLLPPPRPMMPLMGGGGWVVIQISTRITRSPLPPVPYSNLSGRGVGGGGGVLSPKPGQKRSGWVGWGRGGVGGD